MRCWREERGLAHRLRYVLLPCSFPRRRRGIQRPLLAFPFFLRFAFPLSCLAPSASSSPGLQLPNLESRYVVCAFSAMNADGSDANCQERCCKQTCAEMDVQCPEGWQRGEWHRPEWTTDANWPESSCCFLTCDEAGFDGSTCPAGQEARSEHDGHSCTWYGRDGVTDSVDATCTADECCQVTCASADEASCPADNRLRSVWCTRDGQHDRCDDAGHCCEEIPTIENRCSASSADAAKFCWGPGGFAGSCPQGYHSRGEGDCHRASTGVATEADCCYRRCIEIDGLTCPAGETVKEHHGCYGDQCEEECCAMTCANG